MEWVRPGKWADRSDELIHACLFEWLIDWLVDWLIAAEPIDWSICLSWIIVLYERSWMADGRATKFRTFFYWVHLDSRTFLIISQSHWSGEANNPSVRNLFGRADIAPRSKRVSFRASERASSKGRPPVEGSPFKIEVSDYFFRYLPWLTIL